MPDGTCTVVEPIDCAGTSQDPGSTCAASTCMVACCTTDGACTLTTAADCASSGGIAQPYSTSCTTSNCPAAADYADFKAALAATAIVRYEYGASLVQRPRMLATLIALQRVAATNPNITAQQLDAFAIAYDARLRAQIPGDPDLSQGIDLMVAVRFPTVDLAPLPAGSLDGIDTEIDAAVLSDLGLDPYDTSDGDRSKQMEQFALVPVGFLGNSGIVARSLYKLFRNQDADGGYHSGLIPAAAAYLAAQPTWDSPTADSMGEGFIGINPFPSPEELTQFYPAVADALDSLPPTAEEFAAQATSNGLEDVAQGVLGEMAQVTEFADEKAEELRALLNSGYSSLATSRSAAQNAAIVQNAINQRQTDLRTLAERRAGIDIGVLAMQGAALADANRALVLQDFSAVQLQVATQTALRTGIIIFGVAQIIGGAILSFTGAGASFGVPIIISGVATLLPLLGQIDSGTPAPEQQVLDELANIRNQMQNFQIDMQQRLDHIDATIHASYLGLSNQLDIIYNSIGADLTEVRTQLALQSSAMARFESNVYGMLENGFNYTFVADANLALGYRDRFMFDMRYTDNAPSDYQSYENTFYTYAFNQASLPPFVFGAAGATLPALAELDFAAGNTGNPIGSRINLLRTVPAQLGVNNLGPSTVANPTSWATNADAHAQLHRENPWYTAADIGRWNQVRTKGQDAQNVMWAAKSQTLFDALFAHYAQGVDALQSAMESPATLHEWAVDTSCAGCEVNLWSPGANPALQAAYLRWVALKLTDSGATHQLKVAADEATRDIRLMDAYLAMACPGELDRNDLLRGMLRGDELGMDTAAIAQYLFAQAGILESPGAIGYLSPPTLSEGFARYTDVEGFSRHASTLELTPVANYAVDGSAIFVAIGDLNGDGIPDLVTANYGGTNNVSVLLGNGNGTFQTQVDYAVGSSPYSVAIDDLNGDGVLDIVTANFQPGGDNVSVLLGNGDGTFQPRVHYAAGSLVSSVAIGDVSGDGIPDLAVANQVSDNVSVLRGNGDGTFQMPVNYAAGDGPYSIATGDLNGDGVSDIVTANYHTNNVSVLLSNGNSTFQPQVAYAVGSTPYSVAIGDLNGDGQLDLATANWQSQNVSVLLGNGNGTFQPSVNYQPQGLPTSVAIGDLNGDGRSDIVATINGSNGVSVLLGNGNGTFQSPGVRFMNSDPYSVALGDLNGDSLPDIVTVDVATTNAAVLLNRTAPHVAASLAVGDYPISVASGDMNGDGLPDLVTANTGSSDVSLLLTTGTGGFEPEARVIVGAEPNSVTIDDLNRDGHADLVTANGDSGTVSVALGNGDGTLQPAIDYAAAVFTRSPSIGDLNSDGYADIVTANDGSNSVSVLLGNGDGTFQLAANYGTGVWPHSVAVGDLNGDTKLDLVTANAFGSVSVLLGNGDGTLQTLVDYVAGDGPTHVSITDLNSDGRLDLAVANEISNDISVLLGNGDGTFAPAINYGAGTSPRSVTIGDLNGDGRFDLAAANNGSNSVSVLPGNGDGTFEPAISYRVGESPSSVTIGDFNGDGRPDLSVANFDGHHVAILLGEVNRGKDFRDTVNAVITTPLISTLVGDGTTATATCAVPHLFGEGDPVTITGASPAGFNGTFFIYSISPTEFSYACVASGIATGANKRATRPRESYPFMQWTLAGLSHLDRTAGRASRAEQYVIAADTTLGLASTGVLENDVPPPMPVNSSSCMTAVPFSSPTPGTYSSFTPPNSAGQFAYSPPAGFVGTAKFQYKANGSLTPTVVVCDPISQYRLSDATWVSIIVVPGIDCVPTIDTPPLDAEYVEGGTASFLVRASSPAGRMSFQWQRNGVDVVNREGMTPEESTVTGATGSLLTIANMQAGDQGTYTCIVSTGCGSATTLGATLGSSCPADFDNNGTVAVPDIFAFLSAWFAQGPGSDFDNNGAIAVPDIFAFLSVWFAGCP